MKIFSRTILEDWGSRPFGPPIHPLTPPMSLFKSISFVAGLKVCYSPYGCFTNSKPWNLVWHVLPRPPSVVKTFCELYTRKNHKGRRIDPLNIRASRMNVAQKTIVIIHGWKGNHGMGEAIPFKSLSLVSLCSWT